MTELVPTQADREAAADIARFYLGNDAALPEELRWSGSIARHYTLDVLARHRISSANEAIEALGRLADAGAAVLASMDAYNAENGTHLGGPSFFRLGVCIAEASALKSGSESHGG